MKKFAAFVLSAAIALCGAGEATAQNASKTTLEQVVERKKLRCGVNPDLPGFAEMKDGEWIGFDVDFCKAVAAAIFGDAANRVEFVEASATERFKMLRDGQIDLLARNSTWTMGRELEFGILFVGVNYYDGVGFLVPKNMFVSKLEGLRGAKVCTLEGTTAPEVIAAYNAENDGGRESGPLELGPQFPNFEELIVAYQTDRCDAIAADRSQLAIRRVQYELRANHEVLPFVISKEPLAPAVRADDVQWFNIVKWTLAALIAAEELKVTQENAEAIAGDDGAPKETKILLGTLAAAGERTLGEALGLKADWALGVITAVGNYGEIYAAHFGPRSKVPLERRRNSLASGESGLIYAPPLR